MARASGNGTVGKALEVLDLVAQFGRPVRFAEVLDQASFPKATLYRFLQTLTAEGMLTFDSERHTYAPGVRLVRLAHEAWQQSSLGQVARPFIESLSRDVGETVHLAQLDAAQVLYLDKCSSEDAVEMYSSTGKVGPAYCTGVGKAICAYLNEPELTTVLNQQSYHRFTSTTLTSPDALRANLEQVKAQGFALDQEEHERGIICVALPILTQKQRVLGAVSVTSTTDRRRLSELETLVPRIRATAAAIAGEVQLWRFPDLNNIETTEVRTGS